MQIGVYIYHCGLNIGGVLDIDAIVAEARAFGDVRIARDIDFHTTGETSAQPIGLQTRHLTARSGLRITQRDVSNACYKYSTDCGSSWSVWRSASCTGSDGTTSYQTITAGSVPFNLDSGMQNKIKSRIDDTAPNTGVMSIRFG